MNHEMWCLGRNYNIRVGKATLQNVRRHRSGGVARKIDDKQRDANSIINLASNILAADRYRASRTIEAIYAGKCDATMSARRGPCS
jgi:hypothetical protein